MSQRVVRPVRLDLRIPAIACHKFMKKSRHHRLHYILRSISLLFGYMAALGVLVPNDLSAQGFKLGRGQ